MSKWFKFIKRFIMFIKSKPGLCWNIEYIYQEIHCDMCNKHLVIGYRKVGRELNGNILYVCTDCDKLLRRFKC